MFLTNKEESGINTPSELRWLKKKKQKRTLKLIEPPELQKQIYLLEG